MACAIVKSKVRVWHYLPKRWRGEAASDFYKDVLIKALRRNHRGKTSFRILEDNDPTGYKSGRAVDAKRCPLRPVGSWCAMRSDLVVS